MVSGMSISTAFAETAAPAGTEAAEITESNAAGAEADAQKPVENGPDVVLSIGAASLTIKNGTPVKFTKCEYRPVADGADFVLTDETGKETVFEKAEPEKWTEPQIVSRFGFFYIEYKDAAGEILLAAPKGEEITFEQSMSAYPIVEVNVRADADEGAQVLKTAVPGEEWKATASRPGWVKIELNGVIGYAVCGYLTESKDAAEKAAGIVINSAAAVTPTPSAAPTPTPVPAQSTSSGQQSTSSSSYSGNSYYNDTSDYSDYSGYDYSEDYSWSEPDYSDDSGETGGGETGGGETGGGETSGGETGGGETGGGETGGGETGGGETGGGETGGGETGGGETGGEEAGGGDAGGEGAGE